MNLFGGGGKGDSPQNINIPAFTSSGGVTPEQQTLANYGYGQDLMANANLFGGSGTGMSTMATQAAEGAANTGAQTVGGMSDVNQEAMYKDYTNQLAAEEQGLQNDITLSNQSNASELSSLAAAGQLLGSGFGTGTTSSLSPTATS